MNAAAPSQEVEITRNAQTWLRILIASYFIAVALRLIPGTDFSALFTLIAPPHIAAVLSVMTVFSLAYMVMIGCLTRIAALLLGLVTFFAAFVGYVGPEGGELGAFWRDIALVAALMLTYSRRSQRQIVKRQTAPIPVPARAANVTDLSTIRATRKQARPSDLRAPLGPDEIDNIFLDYVQSR